MLEDINFAVVFDKIAYCKLL